MRRIGRLMKEKRMKYVVLVGDGMGDYPLDELGGKTPLQAASIPAIRRISGAGQVYMVQTVPDGMAPGSDVANLSLLGYNPAENYTGRAPIEAAGASVLLGPDDVAYRCNLVTLEDGRMKDYSAGHISTEEAAQLIQTLDKELGRDGLRFSSGVSYRHLMIWDRGPNGFWIEPPHEFTGKRVDDYLPAGEGQGVTELVRRSAEVLRNHPVNLKRRAEGKNEANSIWLWGQGKSMVLPSYQQRFGLSGGIVSAVDLVRGLGVLMGLDAPRIAGATGYLDTNFQGKVDAALAMLLHHDYVYVHIEAPDECGHQGSIEKKVHAIELFDEKVVTPVWKALEERGEPYRLVVCMDHRTPVKIMGHTSEPVPLAMLDGPVGAQVAQGPEGAFDEFVQDGQPQGMSYDIMTDWLKNRTPSLK